MERLLGSIGAAIIIVALVGFGSTPWFGPDSQPTTPNAHKDYVSDSGWRPNPHHHDKADGTNTYAQSSSGTLRLTRNSGGQFMAPCAIAAIRTECLVDSGATTAPDVALIMGDRVARQAGLNISHITFDQSVQTGGGTVRAALVSGMPTLRVGPFTLNNAAALIVRNSDTMILPLDFMNRYNVNIRGGTMTISSD